MPKTRKNNRNTTAGMAAGEAMDSLNGFDPATPSTWGTASLSQLRTLSVTVLQQELKSRNLSHTGNKSTLSKRLHETFNSAADATHSTDVASSHSNIDALSNHSNTLHHLSSQLQQLPQQQLTNLLLQAISVQPVNFSP